jgi:hypoxanthine-DNA glycosylase
MVETHPFGIFSPPNAKYLLLGSFTAVKKDESYDWFYGSKRNQFWPIIEEVYNTSLPNKETREKLFTKLSVAIADMIYQCERRDGNSLDSNLINFVYNKKGLNKLLKENKIQKIFFSSRFVEKEFKKNFKNLLEAYPYIELITLPSPSPRYAAMSRTEKITRYKEVFPQLTVAPL